MTAPCGADFEIAYAKINLALHVRRRRKDGYHELETLFAFAEDGDRLEVEASDALTLTIDGPFAIGLDAGTENLVLRAAEGLRALTGVTRGAALRLTKSLPVAAGIGGGSADAAAALRLLMRHWDCKVAEADLHEFAASLGADVPACLESRTCVGLGIGDQLEPFSAPDLAGLPLLLINPRVPCPTGPVFKAWDGKDRGALDPAHWRTARNDLQAPALLLVPEIGMVLEILTEQEGVRIVRMSGSGATCFATFKSAEQRDNAAHRLTGAYPQWWVLASELRE